jgi:hypothetical protein
MKKFLAVYLGTPAAREQWDKLDEATRSRRTQAGMEAWGTWMNKHQTTIVDSGGPLGKTKRVSETGVADTTNELAGYVILHAESHQAASEMFLKHPHFVLFPGAAVEIMECLPIPQR